MNTTTVKVSKKLSEKIKDISETYDISIDDVIERAITFYENKLFLEKLNIAYAESKNINDDIWNQTLMDGLEEK